MSQSDFTSLAASAKIDLADEFLSADMAEFSRTAGITEGAVSMVKSSDGEPTEVDLNPVNFTPVEVHALITGWHASTSIAYGPSDGMELESASLPVSQAVFEPTRHLHDFAPPKRFYRTYWTSAARRLLALSSAHRVNDYLGCTPSE